MSSDFLSFVVKQLYPQENITGSFHPHGLRLKDALEMPYNCVGCKEKGLGKVYQCEDAENCDYQLHHRCYDLAYSGFSSTYTPLLEGKKCKFKFHQETPGGNKRACDACGKDVKGWFHQCETCKEPHYLHSCCTGLPLTITGENGIVIRLKANTSSMCLACKGENISQGLRGWSYVSNCRKHCYHVGCVMDMALENLKKGGDGCDDDDRCLIKETSDKRKSCSRESSTRAQSRAITKRSLKEGTMKVLKVATKLVLNLIISAIFGIPITYGCDLFYREVLEMF